MRGKVRTLLAVVVLAGAGAACDSGSPTEPPPTGPAELQVTDLRAGTGATLAAGQLITVNYEGWLYDPSRTDSKGTRFDGGQTTFRLNAGLIAGWVQGLPGMKVGGLRRLIIPPSLGYGSAGRAPSIPGNAWLVFDVELLAVAP